MSYYLNFNNVETTGKKKGRKKEATGFLCLNRHIRLKQ